MCGHASFDGFETTWKPGITSRGMNQSGYRVPSAHLRLLDRSSNFVIAATAFRETCRVDLVRQPIIRLVIISPTSLLPTFQMPHSGLIWKHWIYNAVSSLASWRHTVKGAPPPSPPPRCLLHSYTTTICHTASASCNGVSAFCTFSSPCPPHSAAHSDPNTAPTATSRPRYRCKRQ